MRFLVKASWTVEAGNARAREGKLGGTVQAILDELKPEAVYFTAEDGKRTANLIVDLNDVSEIPRIAEPWFLAFDAQVAFHPTMRPEDLEKAGAHIDAAVAKYA
jgi:hypothetical protein